MHGTISFIEMGQRSESSPGRGGGEEIKALADMFEPLHHLRPRCHTGRTFDDSSSSDHGYMGTHRNYDSKIGILAVLNSKTA